MWPCFVVPRGAFPVCQLPPLWAVQAYLLTHFLDGSLQCAPLGDERGQNKLALFGLIVEQ